MSSGRAKRLSCGVVVVRPGGPGMRYLLLRAYRNWDFPKGLLEGDESPLDAAVREVAEETGITDLDFRWGADYVETAPYSRGKIARYYLAQTATERIHLPISPELGRPEHSEYRWVDRAGALALTATRLRPVIDWAAARVGDTG